MSFGGNGASFWRGCGERGGRVQARRGSGGCAPCRKRSPRHHAPGPPRAGGSDAPAGPIMGNGLRKRPGTCPDARSQRTRRLSIYSPFGQAGIGGKYETPPSRCNESAGRSIPPGNRRGETQGTLQGTQRPGTGCLHTRQERGRDGSHRRQPKPGSRRHPRPAKASGSLDCPCDTRRKGPAGRPKNRRRSTRRIPSRIRSKTDSNRACGLEKWWQGMPRTSTASDARPAQRRELAREMGSGRIRPGHPNAASGEGV